MRVDRLIRRLGASVVLASVFASAQAGSYDDFFRAVGIDDVGAVKALLQRGFDPNTLDPKGQRGLTLAMRDDSPRVAQALIDSPALQVDAPNLAGETPLMLAAIRGDATWVQRLLDRGAQVNRSGWTPLHYGASGHEPKVVKLLLDRGAVVDAPSPNGTTPLMMAAQYGEEVSVDLLLARGADPKRRNERGLAAVDFAELSGRDYLVAKFRALR
jgi:ankyrin repeat protein